MNPLIWYNVPYWWLSMFPDSPSDLWEAQQPNLFPTGLKPKPAKGNDGLRRVRVRSGFCVSPAGRKRLSPLPLCLNVCAVAPRDRGRRTEASLTLRESTHVCGTRARLVRRWGVHQPVSRSPRLPGWRRRSFGVAVRAAFKPGSPERRGLLLRMDPSALGCSPRTGEEPNRV